MMSDFLKYFPHFCDHLFLSFFSFLFICFFPHFVYYDLFIGLSVDEVTTDKQGERRKRTDVTPSQLPIPLKRQ